MFRKSIYPLFVSFTVLCRLSSSCFAKPSSGSVSSELKKIDQQIKYYTRRHNARVKNISKSRNIGISLKKSYNNIENKFIEVSERVNRVKNSITQNMEDMQRAEAELLKCYEELSEVLNKIYKSSEGGYGLDVFFDTECALGADDDMCVVYASLSQWGKLIIGEINNTKKELENSRMQLEENKRSLSSLQVELSGQKDSIMKEQEANSNLVNALCEEEKSEKAELDLLEIRKRKLEAQLREEYRKHSVNSKLKRGSGRYIWPVNGPVTSSYGWRKRYGRMHYGLDIGVISGTGVCSAAPGSVVTVGFDRYGWGNYVMVNHGSGYATLYAHLSRASVSPGQHVALGQVIGLSGNTGRSFGPHLHFETWKDGKRYNPMDELG